MSQHLLTLGSKELHGQLSDFNFPWHPDTCSSLRYVIVFYNKQVTTSKKYTKK